MSPVSIGEGVTYNPADGSHPLPARVVGSVLAGGGGVFYDLEVRDESAETAHRHRFEVRCMEGSGPNTFRRQESAVVVQDGVPRVVNEQQAEPAKESTPTAMKWVIAGIVGAVAGLELTAQQYPDPTVQLACRIAAVALGTFAGVASPGLSRFRR